MTRDEEIRLTNESQRGARANALAQSDIYREAVAAVRAAVVKKWEESPLADRDGQHECRLLLHALDNVVGYIADVVETGKMATFQIESERKRSAAARRGEMHVA